MAGVKAGTSYDRRAGPRSGSYGAYWAEGGRIGYQGGELVEDESMAEATPAGMMEENIEEVQGEPSREQLEVIALEIFRITLRTIKRRTIKGCLCKRLGTRAFCRRGSVCSTRGSRRRYSESCLMAKIVRH